MRIFNFIKRKAYTLFAKEEDSHKSDLLSQPKGEKPRSEMTPDDKKSKT